MNNRRVRPNRKPQGSTKGILEQFLCAGLFVGGVRKVVVADPDSEQYQVWVTFAPSRRYWPQRRTNLYLRLSAIIEGGEIIYLSCDQDPDQELFPANFELQKTILRALKGTIIGKQYEKTLRFSRELQALAA